MNYIILLAVLVFLSGITFSEPEQFYPDYCSPKKTNAIKGVFVFLVILFHTEDYFTFGSNDLWVQDLSRMFKQLPVVPFLFYSGFGIMESIQKKGFSYIKSIPLNRIVKTVVFADLGVISFAIYYLIFGIQFTIKQFFLSLVFWDQIGNCLWYLFVIVFLYLFTYISFRIFSKNYYVAAIFTGVISLPLFFVLVKTKDIFWYNTFFCYHFGLLYSLLRTKVERFVMHNDLVYFLSLLIVFVLFSWIRTFGSFYFFMITGCLLMMIIVGISMKVSIDNPVLQFLGNHILPVYLFHRIPMLVLGRFELGNVTKFILIVLITCIFSLLYDFVTAWINRKIFVRS